MSKKVRKGKNAQRKRDRNRSMTRSKVGGSVARQRKEEAKAQSYASPTPPPRPSKKGKPTPLGVKVLVAIVAVTMLTAMGIVSYASFSDFDLVAWLTGTDVTEREHSETSEKSAFTASQRGTIDATGKFTAFYQMDEETGARQMDLFSADVKAKYAEAAEAAIAEADEKRDDLVQQHIDEAGDDEDETDETTEEEEVTLLSEFQDAVDVAYANVINVWNNVTGAVTGKLDLSQSDDETEADDGTVVSTDTTEYDVSEDDTVTEAADDGADETSTTDDGSSASTNLAEVLSDVTDAATDLTGSTSTLAEDLDMM